MKEAHTFLNKLLKNNDTIILGISGGPDSMCLLHILLSLKEKYNLNLICAHINHGLRKESDEEKIFVEKYCKKNNLIFEYTTLSDYKNNKFSEAEARNKRYTFFEELVKKYQANYLMTAHHGDDLIETILMRLVRGSNLKGYYGIPMITRNDDYKIVRPLLSTSKEEIFAYLKDFNIPYVKDSSNELDKYTRNRYRKHMLPFLKQEEKDVHLKFLKFSKELEKYQSYIDSIVNNLIDEIYIDNRIDIFKLKKEDEFIQEKILEYIIRDIQKSEIFNIDDIGFKNIIKLINENNNKEINLKNNFIARRSYNYLYIEKNKIEEEYDYIFKDEFICDKYKIKRIDKSTLKNNNIIRLNSKEISLPIHIRTKQNGDKMQIKNLNGTKKLKDIFIDSKIDIRKRKNYPVIVDSENKILWLPGIKKSIFDKEITEKYDIILTYTEEKDE